TYLAMLIKEKRAIGHVGPGLDTVAKLIVTINPLKESKHLTPAVLKDVPQGYRAELSQLGYTSAARNFRFLHDRRWYLTTDDAKLAVLRMVDRGDLVAQCNLSYLPGDTKSPPNLADFQRDVQDSLGKNFGQFVTAGQETTKAGNRALRVVVHGTVSQLP